MFYKPLSLNTTALLSHICSHYEDAVWLDTARGDGLSILAFAASAKKVFETPSDSSAFQDFFKNFCFRKNNTASANFAGGWIGYLCYEAFAFNPLIPFSPKQTPDYPLAVWRYYETYLEFKNETWNFVSFSNNAEQKWRDFQRLLTTPKAIDPKIDIGKLREKISFSKYKSDIQNVLEALARGDYLELNYTQEFFANCTSLDLWPVYLKLRQICAAPMMAFYNWPEIRILSASPERFFTITANGNITTEPIKGTIARSNMPEEDVRNQRVLQNGEKEKSELIMVTDLLRNDLGRICEIGSVKTPELFTLKSFSHYHHLISKITGQLKNETNFYEVFCALFPGGSITGAPKIQVLRHTQELENRPRGIYTGALGFISNSGFCEFNIPIRTLTHDGKTLKTAVGGGIVAESCAEDEYQECLVKLSGIQKTLTEFETGSKN